MDGAGLIMQSRPATAGVKERLVGITTGSWG